jgi:hypothetical protein
MQNMSTNTILNPRSSIQVGNGGNNTHIPTEAKTNKQHELLGRGNRDDSTIASPDIDRVIRGFRQELDTLSRSFDLIATSHSQAKRTFASSEKPPNTHGTPANRRVPYPSSVPYDPTPTQKRVPAMSESLGYDNPPPPTRSRLPANGASVGDGKSNKSDNGSRSTKKSGFVGDNPVSTDETFVTQTSTRFEEPPPVETPLISTGGATSRYYVDVGEDRYLGRDESLESTIKRMKETIDDQSYTIRQLQRENNDLRRQLMMAQGANTAHDPKIHKSKHQRQPMFDGSNRPRNLETHYDRTHRGTQRYLDDMRPTVSSLSGLRSSQLSTSPRDGDEDENTLETAPRVGPAHNGFTPGTKFVAVSLVLFFFLFPFIGYFDRIDDTKKRHNLLESSSH